MTWHTKNIDETLTHLNTSRQGLTDQEVQKRLTESGFNELTTQKPKTTAQLIFHQFSDFMILVLVLAAVVSGIIGDLTDTLVILLIVLLNAILGFTQEYRAEKAMQALKKMAATNATVIRNGTHATIPAIELVPGDLVMIEVGNIVPADIRLTDSMMLKVDEASLSGESFPAEKQIEALPADSSLPLGDRTNLLFKGTHVTYGRGAGIVIATGMKTELGKIAGMLQTEDSKTPLQKRLSAFGKKLSYTILFICAVIFTTGIIRNEDPMLMLLTVISLAVAAIPEALPAVITIALALGARRMVKQNALIRKLPAVETLGSVTYICTDKTGTLTMNKMSVEEVAADGHTLTVKELHATPNTTFEPLLMAMALSNDVIDSTRGEPTELAVWQAAYNLGYRKEVLIKDFPRIAELPFDSERKCMTTVHQVAHNRYMIITKGALEFLLDKAPPQEVQKYLTASERMANDGLRILGFSLTYTDVLPQKLSPETLEKNVNMVGMVGMMDPPREEVKEAIKECKTAGIKPVMITGDHALTARNIALRLGMLNHNDLVITGTELAQMSDTAFEAQVEHIKVYARVSPEQKFRIVKTLQEKGEYVAMTGDGVNDAPSLKRANIGIAMGITGTDVSKEASHMILLDDNFASIVKAVKQGRRIYDNIRRFIKYALTCNSAEIWTIFLAPLLGLPIPLLPIHILWINLVTDGLPGIALTAEPAEKNIMNKPPRNPNENIFSGGLGVHVLWVGLLMAAITIGTQAFAIHATDDMHWQTMVFTVLSFSQMGHVLAIRSEKQSLFSIGLFSNLPLLGAILLTLILQLSTIYIPALNLIFKTEPLTFSELAISLGLSSVIFFAVEIEKLFKRKNNLR
jgi:P-type Ca2+ transporter type 2C